MTDSQRDGNDKEMHFLDHVVELRQRLMISVVALLIASIVGFMFYDYYVSFLISPFGEKLYVKQIEQGFTTKVKVSLFIGIITSFPIHLYNVVAFIIPALTARERRIVMSFLAGSFALLVFGGILAYVHILPISIQFLKNSSFFPDNVTIWLDYRESLIFIFQLLLAFLALFQLPLVLLVLLQLKIVNRSWVLKYSRYFVISIFMVSAVVTPPDIISQLGLAIPLIFLLFLTIFIAKIFNLGEK